MPLINHRLPAHNSREEAIALKKIWLFLLLTAAAALVLTGCAGSADTLATPTPGAVNPTADPMFGMNPTVSPGMGESATANPENSASPSANGQMTAESAKKASEDMEDAIEKLSEVDEAYVVPLDKTALVGLKFTGQYKGELDDRLKKMILTRVQTVDKEITSLAATDNAALVASIKALTDLLDGASSLTDVNGKAEEVLRQLTVFKE